MILLVLFSVATAVSGSPLQAVEQAETTSTSAPPSTTQKLQFIFVEDIDYTSALSPLEQTRLQILRTIRNRNRRLGGSKEKRTPLSILPNVQVRSHGGPVRAVRRLETPSVEVTGDEPTIGVKVQSRGKNGHVEHVIRRRSPQTDQIAVESTSSGLETIVEAPAASVDKTCSGDLTPIQRVLCKAGARPTPVCQDCEGYGRRRRQAQDFIPFSEYDSRRVRVLKLEQNDFLALPQRLRAITVTEEKRKKRQHLQ